MPERDIRFSLANERTFLAYERTAIGLVAAALAVFHLIEPSWAQRLLGLLLLASAVVAAGVAGFAFDRPAGRSARDATFPRARPSTSWRWPSWS